ncbi:MAG: S-adenosylmethionine:tRNA ribosyltransferase-isomerase, partial [Muribaculaceae bacterium]|nr:S-adenosylmethionine:tRNA ribosyltransferase-isomerase [Muribaculaceae bacterium]
MKLSQFNFNLPKELIAQEPRLFRDDCRLMVVHRKTGEIEYDEYVEPEPVTIIQSDDEKPKKSSSKKSKKVAEPVPAPVAEPVPEPVAEAKPAKKAAKKKAAEPATELAAEPAPAPVEEAKPAKKAAKKKDDEPEPDAEPAPEPVEEAKPAKKAAKSSKAKSKNMAFDIDDISSPISVKVKPQPKRGKT